MRNNHRVTIELNLKQELRRTLTTLRDINQWDDEVDEVYLDRLMKLALLLKDLDRPVGSICELSESEREWLLEMLIEQDLFVKEVLECVEIYNAIANLLMPNEMQTIRFTPHHLELLWRKGEFC
ncbi:hypothetical protein [Vibrio alfacsensis]|uniref:hypothetical protein n=1 Tax=Vibrio alfacsensis TaxID=1074311 RepID=UPI0040681D74